MEFYYYHTFTVNILSLIKSLPCFKCHILYGRCGNPESERAKSPYAEEACDISELPAGGGGGPCSGCAGGTVAGGEDSN